MAEREPLDAAEVNALVALVKQTSRIAMLVPLEDARALLDQHGAEEALFPLLDPTHYIREQEQAAWHGPYLRAFLRFREELERLREQYG